MAEHTPTDLTALDLAPQGTMQIECVVNGPIHTNTYFAISGNEAVVIDPAWDGEKLANDFADRHPDVRIVDIICTHGHGDHVGGVAGMRAVLGPETPFLISAEDAAFMTGAIESMERRWGVETPLPPVPDRLLAEGDTVCFGSIKLQVIATPGHTPGGIVLFCACDEGDIAFVGDTVFPGRHGRTDLEGGNETVMLRSLAHLFRLLPDDTLLLIGHDESSTAAYEQANNPYLAEAYRLGY